MTDLIGKTVECHDMPEGSFYTAVRGRVTSVRDGWAVIQASQVIDRWSILFEDHPTSCTTHARLENIELA